MPAQPTKFSLLKVRIEAILFFGNRTVNCPFDCPPATRRAEPAGHLARVKDVATIDGIRDNQLVGYGLVVGLRGTGDSSQTVFPAQTLLSTLERMGITVPQFRRQQRQQHAGQKHGRSLCRGHPSALQPAGLQARHHGFLGRRCALA